MPWTNAHTHLELSALQSLCPGDPRAFGSWLRRLDRCRKRLSPRRRQQALETAIASLEAADTIYVGDVSRTGCSLEPLLASHLKGIIFREVWGLQPHLARQRLEAVQNWVVSWQERAARQGWRLGLSLHAPYSCHPRLLRAAALYCRQQQLPLCLHVAESPKETGQLQQSGQATPVQYVAELGVLAAQPYLVHAIHVTSYDMARLRSYGCRVIHCPRSNERLQCGVMPLAAYLSAGVDVYLGSDSLASCPDLDIGNELAFAQKLHDASVKPQVIAALAQKPL